MTKDAYTYSPGQPYGGHALQDQVATTWVTGWILGITTKQQCYRVAIMDLDIQFTATGFTCVQFQICIFNIFCLH